MNDSSLLIALSNQSDGSMSKAVSEKTRRLNREKFLAAHGVTLNEAVLVRLEYKGDDYCRFNQISSAAAGDGMARRSTIIADALITREPKLALFLPIADCIAAVLHDPDMKMLGLAHLGRHNFEQNAGYEVVRYMEQLGASASRIRVWCSPAAGKDNYPLISFDNQSMHEVAVSQMTRAGIAIDHIHIDDRDTTTDPTFFSHSQFLKGHRDSDGRQAVVAMMR